MNPPYTYDEIAELKARLTRRVENYERKTQARPLPPLREDEALELITGLLDDSIDRVLTESAAGLIGQLLATYRMAVEARMLGKNGRYFVISQADIERLSR